MASHPEWSDTPEPAKPVYRVGDRLEVEFCDGEPSDMTITWSHGQPAYRSVRFIRHIPAPRPIEVGCRFKSRYSDLSGTVVGTWQDMAWVVCDDRPNNQPINTLVENITRIDDSEAA